MKEDFIPIPDELFGHERPTDRPQVARRRFQPVKDVDDFLNECVKRGLDVSAILNLAVISFMPVIKSRGNTWEGIDSVVCRKKWY
jgi:hypothetical protein